MNDLSILVKAGETADKTRLTLQHTAQYAGQEDGYGAFCYSVRTIWWAVWHAHEDNTATNYWRRIQRRLVRDRMLPQRLRQMADWLEDEYVKPVYHR